MKHSITVSISRDSKPQFRAVLIFLSFNLLAFSAIGCASEQAGQREASLRHLHDARVSSQVIFRLAERAVRGDAESFDRLASERDSMSKDIAHLRNSESLVECAAVSEINRLWDQMSREVDVVIGAKAEVVSMVEESNAFVQNALELSQRTVEMIPIAGAAGASPMQINVASRQYVLANRMAQRMGEVRDGLDMREAVARDTAMFAAVLEGFRAGNSEMGIEPLPAGALPALEQIDASFKQVAEAAARSEAAAPKFFQARTAVDAISVDSEVLLAKANNVADSVYVGGMGQCSIN